MTDLTETRSVELPDGRVDTHLGDDLALSEYNNPDLAPVAPKQRTWSTYSYAALWIGMSHNLATWALAAGLIAVGMSWVQAVIVIAVANVVVLIPMLLNAHAGTKYGIPFPVFLRSIYGVRGANFGALLRAFIACGWFGIQTWLGGSGVTVVLGKIFGDWWANASEVAGEPWTMWVSFAIFWILQMLLIWKGMDTIRRFENWAGPAVLVVAVVMLVWMGYKVGGLGPLVDQPSKLGWGADFWKVFFPSLMGMIAFWATMSLSIPDFTRFSKSQKGQMVGQGLGLPTTMTFFSILAVLITSGGIALYGQAIWDPNQLIGKFDNTIVVLFGVITVVVATLAVNVAANVVSPSYDFSNVFPRFITRRTGGIITGILGIAIMPWRLLESADTYIFVWLDFYGGLFGAIAGVMIADYWIIKRRQIDVPECYRRGGRYWFTGGWNLNAVAATVVGMIIGVGGANSPLDAKGVKTGPFPADGFIPFLKVFWNYNWIAGFVVALGLYLVLCKLVPSRTGEVVDNRQAVTPPADRGPEPGLAQRSS
ncbi:MAG TPA: NCS1 family nucleobase:cation symporter-1 [Segeticoccus sp.]|uniref:NCS1 family nucleobase:cation symporter-1 n=1 Tax=Segeticoccus sp. TaxID=2706531 RepID=UPI002D7E7D75|nr:NCS1 family nucleobase:cation symporter-1 [Segeticoccus sp.]HET8601700.1 NCS1 family nucleobase:cation symporter-1 [Segeticoccus sp.]